MKIAIALALALIIAGIFLKISAKRAVRAMSRRNMTINSAIESLANRFAREFESMFMKEEMPTAEALKQNMGELFGAMKREMRSGSELTKKEAQAVIDKIILLTIDKTWSFLESDGYEDPKGAADMIIAAGTEYVKEKENEEKERWAAARKEAEEENKIE